MKIFLILVSLISLWLCSNPLRGQNVEMDCEGFSLNGEVYKPLVCNYYFLFGPDFNDGSFYLSPNWNYSDKWGIPSTGGPGRFFFSSTQEEQIAITKIGRDMKNIDSMGFNSIRVFAYPEIVNNEFTIPTGSYATYFQILDQLIDSAAAHNLKVILVVGARKAWEYQEEFLTYLQNIAVHFEGNNAILAYDLYNEPFYAYAASGPESKLAVASFVKEWCDVLRSFDSNHLITIGLTHPETIIHWDPMIMPIDFVSFHFYAWTENLTEANKRIGAYLYWVSQNINMPYIIGETGYSGTNESIVDPEQKVGTELQQALFAVTTMKNTLNCNGLGYSWWQYQEINWQDPWEDHLGLVDNYGINGFNDEHFKAAASTFEDWISYEVDESKCVKPSNYYNIYNHQSTDLEGTVIDVDGNPIENAVVVGWKQVGSEWPYYITYTDVNGNYTLKSNTSGYPINTLWVSYPGFSVNKIISPVNGNVHTLYQINKNNWTQTWSNFGNSTLGEWNFSVTDKLLTGDFNGDGETELLCVSGSTGASDTISLIKFNSLTNHWDILWSNNGDASSGNGIYPYRHKLIAGDFNGDGRDDILGVDILGNWVTTFKFDSSNQWIWWQSNYGYTNNSDFPLSFLKPYSDYIVSGDFDGNGRDELLCSALPNGNTTLFKFVSNQWTLSQSDMGLTNNPNHSLSYLRPYRDKFLVADFNDDGKEEVLGIDQPNGYITKFSLGNNGIWTWDWSDYGSISSSIAPYRNNLISGRFDYDNMFEILGFASWATMFNFSAGGSLNWAWSTYQGGEFSNWQVEDGEGTYIAVRTNVNSPDQLLAINYGIGSTTASLYALNYHSDCDLLGKRSKSEPILMNDKSLTFKKPAGNKVDLFPNPASNRLYFTVNSQSSEDIDFLEIDFISSAGKLLETMIYRQLDLSSTIEIDLSSFSSGLYILNFRFKEYNEIHRIVLAEGAR